MVYCYPIGKAFSNSKMMVKRVAVYTGMIRIPLR